MGRSRQRRGEGGKQAQKADLEHAQQDRVSLLGEFSRQDNATGVQAGLQQTQRLAHPEPGNAVLQRQEAYARQRHRRAQQRPVIRGLSVQRRLKQRHDDDGRIHQKRHGGGVSSGQGEGLAGHDGEKDRT